MLKRSVLITIALAPAVLLSACGGTQNRGLESVHQPVVARTDYVYDVTTNGNTLAPEEAHRLDGWMQSLRLGYGDHVAIDDPSSYGRSGVRDDIQALAARYGLLVSDTVPVTNGVVTPGTVRVVVSRVRATVPGCPDYSRTSQPEFNSNTSSNQGCAVNSNLAAMVANPLDLVRGQPGANVSDPVQSSKAIDAYRKAAPAAPSAGGGAGGGAGGKSGGSK